MIYRVRQGCNVFEPYHVIFRLSGKVKHMKSKRVNVNMNTEHTPCERPKRKYYYAEFISGSFVFFPFRFHLEFLSFHTITTVTQKERYFGFRTRAQFSEWPFLSERNFLIISVFVHPVGSLFFAAN